MIWENPFLIKNYEGNISTQTFLDLFNCSVLEMITEDFFYTTNYISSSPGAGKTSLFKAFSPSVLKLLKEESYQKQYRAIYKQMVKKKVLAGEEVRMISCYISCARNYGLLEEIVEEKEREWIFSAMINFRVIIAMLRSLSEMESIDIRTDMSRITFERLPEEMSVVAEEIADGAKMFAWVCEQEKALCRYLDGNTREKPTKYAWQMTLCALKIFEPSNICIDGKKKFNRTLMILDDFHKLTNKQKQFIVNALYTIRPGIACWIGQRMIGLTPEQIISPDGSVGREYQRNIVLDNFWENNKAKYKKAVSDIADRRVRCANISGLDKFTVCMAGSLEKENESAIKKGITDIKEQIEKIHYAPLKYQLILEDLEKEEYSEYEKAKRYESLLIRLKRDESGQMTFYLGEIESLDSFQKWYQENENAAEYYFCRKYNIPYYFGAEKLVTLSSNNIEQYLFFASGIFERSRASFLKTRKRQSNYRLSAGEQHKYIMQAARKRWEDINFRYSEAPRVQLLLNNIGKISQRIADMERNSYSGGTITGIGIRLKELTEAMHRVKKSEILELIIKCVSDRYLEKKKVEHGESYIVFYLNRWICAYFNLPLAQGGFKTMTLERAEKLLSEQFNVQDF